jgi:DNA polymerase III epsilon subunit-like protein
MTFQLTFFDTEATDFDDTPERAAKVEIIEYAAVRWTDGNAQPICHEYAMPRNGCTEQAAKVNGYTPELWAERAATKFAGQHADTLCSALDGQTLAGSNPDFDMRMVKRECERIARVAPNWSYRSVNTASAAIFLWLSGAVENTKLNTLGAFFGCNEQRHTALDDCYLAIAVFEGLHDLYVYRSKMVREGLIEIANDEKTDNDLRDYALALSEGQFDS